MATKLQLTQELFESTKEDVTKSIENWQNYLDTASRLYKYNFDDQLLIHAQRPDATAVAKMELWNNKMSHWVKSGSKGIALLRKTGGGRPRLEYVFDISDTRALQGAKSVNLWQMKESYKDPITERFNHLYGEAQNTDFGNALMEYSARSVGEHYREFLHDLNYDLEDSFLEELDELNVEVKFKEAATVSVQYTLLKRCGLDPMDYLEYEDFQNILEFNTGDVLYYLGNLTNTVSKEMLVEIGAISREVEIENYRKPLAISQDLMYNKNINFNTLERQSENLKEDISNEQTRDNLQQGGRLSDTELSSGNGRWTSGQTGQIWTSQGNIPPREQERTLQQDVLQRDTVETSLRDRQDSTGASGLDDGTNDEVARGDGRTESQRPNVVGANGNEYQSTGRGSSLQGISVRIENNEDVIKNAPILPTVIEQIEQIAETKATEKSVAFSFAQNSLFDDSVIPSDIVDKVISTGNCEITKFNLPLIAGHFAYTTDLQDNVKFLQDHYGTGGKGFDINGQKYSVWFNETGMQIAKGTSVRLSRSKITLSWEQVAEKVRGLLEDGRFVNNEILEKSQESYMHHIAGKYSYMYRDRDDGYKNEKLDNIVTRFGYPDCLVEISKHFKDSEKFADMNAGLEQMIQDNENSIDGIMRFKSAARSLYAMADIIKDMNNEPIKFPHTREDFIETSASFITQDEFDYYFIGRENSVNDRKIETYLFFQSGKDSKEKARFLSDKQGLAGHSGDGLSTMSSAKGIEFNRGEILNPYEKTILNYGQISKRIEGYIRENRYLNDLEKAHIPDFTKQKLAVSIKSFYHHAPKDLERPFEPDITDYWGNVNTIAEQIDNDGFVDNLLEQMQYALDNTLSDERGFDDMQKTFDDVTAYKNGTYEVYPSKFKRFTPVKQTEKVIDETDIMSLARKLENKRQPTLLADEYGQLSLDFSPQSNYEDEGILNDTEEIQGILNEQGLVVSEDLIEYAKEQLDENATTETVADKVLEIYESDKAETTAPQEVEAPKGTPAWQEYSKIKAEHNNEIVLYPLGDFYEAFGEDSKLVSDTLGLTQTSRNVGLDEKINMCGFPYHILDENIKKLNDSGLDVTVINDVDGVKTPTIFRANGETVQNKTPVELYREYLPIVAKNLNGTLGHHYVTSNNPDKNVSLNEISLQIERNINQLVKEDTNFIKAYKELPLFKEFFNQDVYYQKYENRTDDLISQSQNNHNLPTWIFEKKTNEELTKSKEEMQIATEKSIDVFAKLKSEMPDKVIGVQVDKLLLFYGEDAKIVSQALGRKIIERNVPLLGTTSITGDFVSNWRMVASKLSNKGISFHLSEEKDGKYTLLSERTADEYLPLGSEVEIDGQVYTIENIDYENDIVYFKNANSTLPVMEKYSVSSAREMYLEQADRNLEKQALQNESEMAVNNLIETVENISNKTEEPLAPNQHIETIDGTEFVFTKPVKKAETIPFITPSDLKDPDNFDITQTVMPEDLKEPEIFYPELKNKAPDILFFNDFKDLDLDYSKYKDRDVIGYNAEGVKYTVGKMGNMTYTTQTTSITPYGEVLGDSMTPEIYEKFKAWKDSQSIDLDFDGGNIESEPMRFEKPVNAPETDIVIDNSPKLDFTITNDDLGKGTKGEKYHNNIEAIKTLKLIESENRRATADEQEILSKYIGWGGLAEHFEETHSSHSELAELLTPDELTSARKSTLNAHYTSPTVIRAMYKALENMDIPKGNILEPAMGVGNFFGMMPENMANSKMYGVELDSITGRIAKQLYQNANIQIKGFETTNHSDNFFDMAIGNVPFGGFSVPDKKYDKHKFMIHDYFFAKTLDKVRSGGIVAFITSKGTLDKQSSEVRKYLAERADLLGAIRLPNTAFKANAGTEVTSDIIFLQKRDTPPEIMPSWVELGQTENEIAVNQYFIENPQMILGKMENISGMYGFEPACLPNLDTPLSEQLEQAIQHIKMPDKSLLKAVILDEKDSEVKTIEATPNVRNFSYTLVDGDLYFRENSRMKEVNTNDVATQRIKGLLNIRDTTREIIDMQLRECSDEALQKEQKTLNLLYDSFSKKYGTISSRANKSAFEQDVSYPLLCSLEHLDDEGKLKAKADIFTKRTIKQKVKVTSVDTPSEALAVSIGERASVDIEFMKNLLGDKYTTDELINGLKGIIFKDHLHCGEDNTNARFLTADEYLSGNVREKLGMVEGVIEKYPEFQINLEMLQKVQPKDLSASEIDVRIGATWIEPKYYEQFMFELLGTPRWSQGDKIGINYSKHSGEWNVRGKSEDKGNPKCYSTFGTKRKNAYQIIEDSLNLRDVRIFDKKLNEEGKEIRVLNPQETTIAQQKQEQIGEAFKDWIWKDPQRREELATVYNHTYNSTRPREYDGSHITFEGMTSEIKLNPHQQNAVAHILYGGNTLLAHCVGAGKTFEMIAAAMESKRLGLCNKSLFVVPNHLTEQIGGDVHTLYPGANILVATKKDFEPANRKKFCSRIATGDFDIVVIGHTQFEKIPLSSSRQKAILQEQISEIMYAIQDAKAQNGERYTIKQLEKTRITLETKLKKLSAEEKKDSVVTFEELGVDRLFVDEAHSFKNLMLHTKMRNVAGIGQSEAQKSTDMFTKCRYMDELTGGKGIVFATGTPVSNSMTELYTMMRYLQYETLERQDLIHFDSWAANFGEKVTAIELAPEGTGFRSKTRFAKFFNLPELINMWKECADIQTADMLNLPVPKAEHITVVTKPSDFQVDMVADLAERAEDVRDRKVEPYQDNMLKITSDGRKLALDQRLNNDMLPDDTTSKVNTCIENAFKIWEETADKKGSQLLFCDLSTPKGDGTFNVYDDIKNKLIEKGVPPNEIAFIHDANTEQQKETLFSKVRNGDVRFLLGSTGKMGAGTNCQNKLVALHHLDCPWRPSDLEQREGRIVRRGNENEEVKIFKYVTERTFDAYNWSLIENKQKFIGQIFTSKSPARSADDVDATALSYAEVKALATGDDRIREKMELDIDVAKLKLMRSNHNSQKYEMEDRLLKFYPQEIKKIEERIQGLTEDLKVVQTNPLTSVIQQETTDGTTGAVTTEDDFKMVINGVTHTERKTAGEAIIAMCKQIEKPDDRFEIGSFRGFPMSLYLDSGTFKIALKGAVTHTCDLENSVTGNITRINNVLESMSTKIDNFNSRTTQLKEEMKSAQAVVDTPFPREEEYNEKVKKLAKLNIELDQSSKKSKGEKANDEKSSEDVSKPVIERKSALDEKPSIIKQLNDYAKESKSTPQNRDDRRNEVAL